MNRTSDKPPFASIFETAISRANAWTEGQDPATVYEALALVCVAQALSLLASVSKIDRDSLIKVGRRSLLQAGGRSDEDAEALALVLPVARLGLSLLVGLSTSRGSSTSVTGATLPDEQGAPVFLTHPSPRELVAMTHAEPDAFSAAQVAAHLGRCMECAGEVSLLARTREVAKVPLRAAASNLSPMMSPTEGRSLGTCSDLPAEAVLFDGGLLAVYAQDALAVRLVVEGGTTDDMRPGYWAGRVPVDADSLDATLFVGDKSVPWKIRLPS